MKTVLPHDAIPTPLDEIRVRILNCQAIRLAGPVWWRSDNNRVPYWRLYWNKTAGAALIVNKRRIPLLPDKIYLVTPDTVTCNRRRCALDHYFIHFVADAPYDHVAPGVIDYPATPELTAAFAHLQELADAGQRQRQLQSTRMLFLCYHALSMLPDDFFRTDYQDQRVRQAIACMHQNIACPADTATLAHAAGMHPTAFIRLFKKSTGLAPHAFYQIRRVEEACRLLHSTDHKLDDIAAATGFYDRFHFSRVFSKIRGMTPAQFRRKR